VSKTFEFAESFLKPAKLALAGFPKWRALYCRLFKRELFIRNILDGLKLANWPWPVFKSSLCSSENLSSNRSKGFACLEKLSVPKIQRFLALNG
jgi:hypothetical protein